MHSSLNWMAVPTIWWIEEVLQKQTLILDWKDCADLILIQFNEFIIIY